jgi:DNA modification methylase
MFQKRMIMPASNPTPIGLLRNLEVVIKPVHSLVSYDRNPQTHTKKQVRQIAESIRTFGFTNPILIDEGGGVIAGHGRLAAAKHLGLAIVPTIRLDQLSEAEKRAYILADNRLAEKAGWDEDLLRLELEFLSDLEIELDVTVTGFEIPEIDLLLIGDEAEAWDEADDVPAMDRATASVTRLGDLWQLGPHRLYCGDATDASAFTDLMAGTKAELVFTDPPYNVPIDGHVSGLGTIKHREFPMASGEMSPVEFKDFLTTVLGQMAAYSRDGALHFVCMDWRHMAELLAAGEAVYSELKNLCIWDKGQGGMGSLYRSRHELIFVFKHGRAAHLNNIELGRHGRNRTNVWTYPSANRSALGDHGDRPLHPTVKPVAMVADALLDGSRRGGIVLDGFGGSGTTLIAAERTGRRGYLMELDPLYVDLAITRYQRLFGAEVVHEASDMTFEALRNQGIEEESSHGGG